jgi:hypothetical protein
MKSLCIFLRIADAPRLHMGSNIDAQLLVIAAPTSSNCMDCHKFATALCAWLLRSDASSGLARAKLYLLRARTARRVDRKPDVR